MTGSGHCGLPPQADRVGASGSPGVGVTSKSSITVSLLLAVVLALLAGCARPAAVWDGRRGYDGNGDYGYDLDAAVARLRDDCAVPIYTGLPFGHVRDKLTLPVGGRLALDVRDGAARLAFHDYAPMR